MNEPINWTVVAQVLVPIVVAGLGTWGYAISKKAQKGTRENAIIDQLQEQVDKADERSDKQDARMARIEKELDRFKVRERIRDDYIVTLRRHIEIGAPPPPPPWPAGLND